MTTTEPRQQALAPIEEPRKSEAQGALDMISRAASDPNVDVGKLTALFELRQRIIDDERKTAFYVAMRAAQEEMLPVLRDAENSHTRSRYARLEKIDEVIRPIYTKHGFSLTFNSPEDAANGCLKVTCDVLHDGGYSRPYSLVGALDLAGPQGKANKNGMQATGSSVSYLRRYLTVMIFNLVMKNDDDDAQSLGAINAAQVQIIEDFLHELGIKMGTTEYSKFLRYCEAASIPEIARAKYNAIVQRLEEKRRGDA